MKLRESWAAFGSVYNDFIIPIKIKTAIATEGIHDSLNTYTGSRSSHTLVAVQAAPSGHYVLVAEVCTGTSTRTIYTSTEGK